MTVQQAQDQTPATIDDVLKAARGIGRLPEAFTAVETFTPTESRPEYAAEQLKLAALDKERPRLRDLAIQALGNFTHHGRDAAAAALTEIGLNLLGLGSPESVTDPTLLAQQPKSDRARDRLYAVSRSLKQLGTNLAAEVAAAVTDNRVDALLFRLRAGWEGEWTVRHAIERLAPGGADDAWVVSGLLGLLRGEGSAHNLRAESAFALGAFADQKNEIIPVLAEAAPVSRREEGNRILGANIDSAFRRLGTTLGQVQLELWSAIVVERTTLPDHLLQLRDRANPEELEAIDQSCKGLAYIVTSQARRAAEGKPTWCLGEVLGTYYTWYVKELEKGYVAHGLAANDPAARELSKAVVTTLGEVAEQVVNERWGSKLGGTTATGASA